MIKFGTNDSLVIPLVLPGTVLCLGAITVIHLFAPDLIVGTAKAIDSSLPSPMGSLPNNGAALAAMVAAVALVVYLASLLLGVLLAILSANVELLILDRIQVKRSNSEDYWDQWYRYVEHLEDQSCENAFLAGMADIFLFQLRTAVALVLLALLAGILAAMSAWQEHLTISSIAFLAVGILIFWSSYRYHDELARMRRRRFSNPPRAIADAADLLESMLFRWCERKAFKPLAAMLPVWPLQSSKTALIAAVKATEDVMALPVGAIFEAERDKLKSLKRLLETEAARAA